MSLNQSKLVWGMTSVLFFSVSGCQCVSVSERYGDVIDRVSDQQICLDNFYRPGLDVTRIGRSRVHQEAAVCNTGFYQNSTLPVTTPVEPAIPPVPPSDSIPQEPATLPPAPMPPVPATLQLPIIDINNLKEVSEWAPPRQPASAMASQVVQSSAQAPIAEPGIDLSIKAIPPVEQAQSLPQEPISAPASVPPSQRYYSARQTK